jgi:hypothetical protein
LSTYDTILTPLSLSSTTDTTVDSLPGLFLAYCTITDDDDVVSVSDRVMPRPSGSDHTPSLLIDYTLAFGLIYDDIV